MEIQRINTYDDKRFSQTVLHQHGCFLADGEPYEVEIISDYEAVISGENQTGCSEIIEEFRFGKNGRNNTKPIDEMLLPLLHINIRRRRTDSKRIRSIRYKKALSSRNPFFLNSLQMTLPLIKYTIFQLLP